MMDESNIELNLKQYLAYERVDKNRRYIEELANDVSRREELHRLLGCRLLFGTAGIRGAMGPGYGQMNELVVVQTSQGLASYLLEHHGREKISKSAGVLIGHDARYKSVKFALLAALAFLQKGIKVQFSEQIAPTPMIAYGVRRRCCLAGVVVTASHNPKEDNGYKVYWNNGAQILTPHDINIQAHIAASLEPWPMAWLGLDQDGNQALREIDKEFPQLFSQVHKQLAEEYFAFVKHCVDQTGGLEQEDQLGIAYTSMHGVGHEFVTRALRDAGFKKLHPVERQQAPDPDFPTVKFPNPEERGALDLAFETAAQTGSRLILANDPDADRCAAALYEPSTGERRVLTGNELGALLGWWLWHNRPYKSSQAKSRYYMLSTAVSSRFLQTMARHEGFNFVETLTGFKYMGNQAEKIENELGGKVLFAFEEAIGYMVSSELLDKDGITAAVQLARCAEHLWHHHKRSLVDQLDWLHSKYGYHANLNSYYICREPELIKRIFEDIQAKPPADFGAEFPISRWRDLNLGYDSATPDNKPELPTSSSSFMVTFFVRPQLMLTIRTSGTEPKIKYYSEIVVPVEGEREQVKQAKIEAQDKLARFVTAAIERCLAPSKHKLKAAG